MNDTSQQPIVKAALGEDWDLLPEVLRKNFQLTPGEDCKVTLIGTMYEVRHTVLAKLFVYAGQVCGALVPWQGDNVPIRIEISTRADDPRFMYWRRIHRFPGRPEFVFSSRMEYLEGNELIERVRFGIGMRMKVSLDNGNLKFTAACYQWDVLGMSIRIPNWLLLGCGTILEREVSQDQFEMFFEIRHPWMGKTFSYCGIFEYEGAEGPAADPEITPNPRR